MTNVISFAPRTPVHRGPARYRALATTFADARRFQEDVYWLKENAEFLNILQSVGADVPPDALNAYSEFYAAALDKLTFFPQYYRFLLGIALDLEDLGLDGGDGDVGARMCAYVRDHNLVAAELSDLQRGEAMRLLARRGVAHHEDGALKDRLVRFAANAPTFAIPNRKAAYELTHIVFYLSDYGHKPTDLPQGVCQSLIFTGFMALLEQNIDLLAEVCIALRFGGWNVPAAWDAAVDQTRLDFDMEPGRPGVADDYHCFLMTNWNHATRGGDVFDMGCDAQGTGFYLKSTGLGALGTVSQALFEMGAARTCDWTVMKGDLLNCLPGTIADHLCYVSETAPEFAQFFAAFARAPLVPDGSTPEPLHVMH